MCLIYWDHYKRMKTFISSTKYIHFLDNNCIFFVTKKIQTSPCIDKLLQVPLTDVQTRLCFCFLSFIYIYIYIYIINCKICFKFKYLNSNFINFYCQTYMSLTHIFLFLFLIKSLTHTFMLYMLEAIIVGEWWMKSDPY